MFYLYLQWIPWSLRVDLHLMLLSLSSFTIIMHLAYCILLNGSAYILTKILGIDREAFQFGNCTVDAQCEVTLD